MNDGSAGTGADADEHRNTRGGRARASRGPAAAVPRQRPRQQYLHWHHCHRPLGAHRPLGYLILVADGLHNLIGGLAIGAAFVTDLRLGVVTWLVAAAHEVPQELGDFGILVHSGWPRRAALAYNLASASTVLVGAMAAYALAAQIQVAVLLAFAAGNFPLYRPG